MPSEEVTLVTSINLTGTGSGNTGRHWRIVIPSAQLLSDAIKVRVLVDYTAAWSLSSMYVGHKGTGTYDFDGSQVAITFGGNPGLSVSAETWSDWIDYEVDASKTLIISLACTSSSIPYGQSTGKSAGYNTGGESEAAATASGTMSTVTYIVAIKGLLAMTPGGTVIMVGLDQSWADVPVISADHGQLWGLKLGGDLRQSWGDAPALCQDLYQLWGNAPVVRGVLAEHWREMAGLCAPLVQPWHTLSSLMAATAQPWALTSAPIQTPLEQGWTLHAVDIPVGVLVQPWAVAQDGEVLTYTVSATAAGSSLGISHINIEGGQDQDVLTAEIHVETEDDYLRCPFATPITITITSAEGIDVFSLVVTAPRITEAWGDTRYIIEAMSPAALLGPPYAGGVEGELTGTAAAIAASLAGSVPISWQTVNWSIPPCTWIAVGETPLELLKQLAGAVGAVVQSDPDGTVTIRPQYPVALPKWSTATPAVILTETLDCFSAGATPEHRSGCNRYLVANQSAGADRLSLESTDLSAALKEVRGYQVPWTGAVTLTHTGGAWVQIEPMGIEERAETEVVEIVAGYGRTRYPIYAVVSMAWQQINLGTITTSEDGGLTAALAGQSLVAITYTTRCLLWRVRNARNEQLQLVAEL